MINNKVAWHVMCCSIMQSGGGFRTIKITFSVFTFLENPQVLSAMNRYRYN